MKGKIYNANPGETIKIISSKIQQNLGKKKLNKKRKKKIIHERIEKIKNGKFKNSDLKYLIRGIDFIQIVGETGIENAIRKASISKEDVDPKTLKMLTMLRLGKGAFFDFLDIYKQNKLAEYNTQREIASLEQLYEIIQSSRDEGITRKQTRKEFDENGKEIEIESEIPMSELEVANILKEYRNKIYTLQDNKFRDMLNLGMSITSLLGAINQERKNSKSGVYTLSIGALVNVGTFFAKRFVTKDYGRIVGEEDRKVRRLEEDLILNEPISEQDEKNKKNEIIRGMKRTRMKEDAIAYKVDIINAINAVATTLIVGKSGMEKLKESSDLNPQVLAKIMLDINSNYDLIRSITRNVAQIYDFKMMSTKTKQIEEIVEDIVKQIEEKQDPLVEIEQPFDKLEIKDFKGKFYKEKDAKTGKETFKHTINIPEFSMKRGQVVLLSGKSGRGKSTFLKLLKRGNIDNRNCIKIDENKTVDKLGNQFIAIKADKDLGINTNVLKQIIGKESLSEPNQEEMERLTQVLTSVNLNTENIIEELASKSYAQFSTGQKKRLVLAQVLYKSVEKPSVILVDEPVGNVEDELIKEQLKTIAETIRDIGSMGIIVTHRVDVAKKYVDKHYEIGEDGKMTQIEMKKEENEKEK